MALGPVVIALPRLFLLLGVIAALLTARLLERRGGASLERPLWWSLLGGLLAARLVYVLTHLTDFREQPWQALFVWQDGYAPLAGIAAAATAALWFIYRHSYRPQRLLAPLLVGLTAWGGLNAVHDALRRATDKPLPALTVEDLQGVPVTLDSFRGQPVVLNLWASWCPPCRREMPMMAELAGSMDEAEFVFANQGESRDAIDRYLAENGIALDHVLLDSFGELARHYGAPGLPATLFVGADGVLSHAHLGEISRETLQSRISGLLTRQD